MSGGRDVSVVQPEWAPDGSLVFISDESGWWNLTRWSETGISPLLSESVDHGGPAWVFGLRTYSFSTSGDIVLKDTRDNQGSFRTIGLETQDVGVRTC